MATLSDDLFERKPRDAAAQVPVYTAPMINQEMTAGE